MTIARGQMKRQLYNQGTGLDNLKEKIGDPEVKRILNTLEDVTLDYINESDDEEFMKRMQDLYSRPEYQYNEDKPYKGPRDMRMSGGILSAPVINNRVNAFGGFGGFFDAVGDALGGAADTVGDIVGGAADTVGDIVSSIDSDDLDKIAQVASFIPGPHQPFAQAYTTGSSSGMFGNDYGGFQIGGYTPSGGSFGTTSTSGPSFGDFSFADTGGGIFDTQSSGAFQSEQGIGDFLKDASIRLGTEYLKTKAAEKQQEMKNNQAYEVLKYGKMSREDAIKIYGGAAVATAMAKLAKESEEAKIKKYEQGVEEFKADREAKRKEYAAARRPEVRGRPETAEDVVVRPTAMSGGIMNTRQGFMMGSEVPLRQNPQGVTEMDFRNTGGFVPPIGIKEKADDIPAMLSNNEFVFTADAVRAAGGGSVNEGAQKMYALMKQLEGQA